MRNGEAAKYFCSYSAAYAVMFSQADLSQITPPLIAKAQYNDCIGNAHFLRSIDGPLFSVGVTSQEFIEA